MTTLWSLYSPSESIMTKGANLKTSCFLSWQRTVGLQASGRNRTTQNEMVKLSASIGHMWKPLNKRGKKQLKGVIKKVYQCIPLYKKWGHRVIPLLPPAPQLPILLFQLTPETETSDHQQYMKRWKNGMQQAYEIARENGGNLQKGQRN